MGKPLAVVSTLLLLLTYLLAESRMPDQDVRAQMLLSLQALQLHDAELNRDVLMARAGLLPNYDSLVRTGDSMSADVRALLTGSAGLSDAQAAPVKQEVVALSSAVKSKLSHVEYLKSDNALLRNSLAYFTQVVGSLQVPEIAAVSQAMLQFVQSPGSGMKAQAEAALARVTRSALPLERVKPLNVHGRLVMDVLPRADRILHRILESPAGDHAERLHAEVLRYGATADRRAQRFRMLLYLVALVLLGYLVHQYTRLRAKARELRRKEIQLIQANKMTALGTLVSSVAHEVNNPNQIVLMNAGVLAGVWNDAEGILDSYHQQAGGFAVGGLEYKEMRGTMPELIREIQDAARRVEGILQDLRDFVRPGVQTAKIFQLNEVVQRAIRLLAHVIQKRTDYFHLRLADGLPPLYGNPQQVEQVVVNLVLNALEALPDRRRTVTVSTSQTPEESPKASPEASPKASPKTSNVSLDVEDEGIGIPRDHLSRLGEPFFTTKEATGGTGLGLAITSSLVKSHKGQITFSSKPGKGTRATVVFPCASTEEVIEREQLT